MSPHQILSSYHFQMLPHQILNSHFQISPIKFFLLNFIVIASLPPHISCTRPLPFPSYTNNKIPFLFIIVLSRGNMEWLLKECSSTITSQLKISRHRLIRHISVLQTTDYGALQGLIEDWNSACSFILAKLIDSLFQKILNAHLMSQEVVLASLVYMLEIEHFPASLRVDHHHFHKKHEKR